MKVSRNIQDHLPDVYFTKNTNSQYISFNKSKKTFSQGKTNQLIEYLQNCNFADNDSDERRLELTQEIQKKFLSTNFSVDQWINCTKIYSFRRDL